MSNVININDRNERVRVHQEHLNDRLRGHGDAGIAVTGVCDAKTVKHTARAAWFLGAQQETVANALRGSISAGLQDMIANPDGRGPEQRRRARDRRGKPLPGIRHVLVQAGHLPPREPGFPAVGTEGEQQLVKAIRDKLVKMLNSDGRFIGIPVPGDIPDGVKVDAALFLHADGVNDPSAGGFQFGFPVTDANRKLVANLRQEFLSLDGHPKSRSDNSTEDAREYFGFRRVRSQFKVLVEHGFLTNPTERQWLRANVGNLARAEYEALCRTFTMTPAAGLPS